MLQVICAPFALALCQDLPVSDRARCTIALSVRLDTYWSGLVGMAWCRFDRFGMPIYTLQELCDLLCAQGACAIYHFLCSLGAPPNPLHSCAHGVLWDFKIRAQYRATVFQLYLQSDAVRRCHLRCRIPVHHDVLSSSRLHGPPPFLHCGALNVLWEFTFVLNIELGYRPI